MCMEKEIVLIYLKLLKYSEKYYIKWDQGYVLVSSTRDSPLYFFHSTQSDRTIVIWTVTAITVSILQWNL